MIEVNRIPGNIHFSFEEFEKIVFQLREKNLKGLDLTHTINYFRFDGGATRKLVQMKEKFGDKSPTSPLDHTGIQGVGDNNNYVYFLNVIRTVYNEKGTTNHTLNQYTSSKYTSRIRNDQVPAMYMRYDIAPIYVYYTFKANSIMHFLVRIIAIIGGVITVAGIFVSFLQSSAYHIVTTIKK